MSGFHDRMTAAQEFEQEVIDRFNKTGWTAFSFGQGQLPESCRESLRRYEDGSRRPSLLRWMPDIITFKDTDSRRSYVALIDAKSCKDRPNYALEKAAIETAGVFTDQLYTPTFFVFDDWKVITPRDATERGQHGPENSSGSGTPYVLINKRHGRDFTSIFPPVRPVVVPKGAA